MIKKLSLAILTILLFASISFSQTNANLFFVFLNNNPDKEQLSESKVKELQKSHMDNIDVLNREGHLFAAGPLDGGGGIFILHADDIEQAKAFLRTDPAIEAHRFIVEIFPFTITNGNMIGVKEPYEMVTYQLVRLFPNTAIDYDQSRINYTNRLFMSDLHNKYNKLVVHGWFGEQMEEGSVLIMKATDKQDAISTIEEHPAVISGDLEFTVTPLYIAKGLFGEK